MISFSKFFSNIQETTWYRAFLNPVIEQVSPRGNVLDIGTGSGKLIQILAAEKGTVCVGVDTSTKMLEEARRKLKESKVSLLQIEPNKKLPFEDNSFDSITICSVLFHFKPENIDLMLEDAQRLLKKEGKIIILTPTGKRNVLSLSRAYFSLKNLSIYIWFYATQKRAIMWTKNKYLEAYASKQNLKYESQIVMNGFAQLEIIRA